MNMNIRKIPASVSQDPPEPAKPGEFQTVTLSQQRTTDEVKRADQSRDPVFRASHGARFEGTLQLTDAGAQASFKIFAEAGNATKIISDLRVFPIEPQALYWLDKNALAHGFDRYPLEKVT
jgi:hypothetical protein